MLAALVYPHQLFENHPALKKAEVVFVIEEPLLFTQYQFHRQKLMLHRASMKRFAASIKNLPVHYVEVHKLSDTCSVTKLLANHGVSAVQFVELNDDWLHQRLTTALEQSKITYCILNDPHFLTSTDQFEKFAGRKKKLFFTEFYIQQRRRFGYLLNKDGTPRGGQWSFDPENRKKLPAKLAIPSTTWARENEFAREARQYVATHFPQAPGADRPLLYPTSHAEARNWLATFVQQRLATFGDYEDAMHPAEPILFHSVLTPMLNIGLLSPREVVEAALESMVPINSLEGFVRQVIGWREFIRGVYHHWGRRQRSRNSWGHTRAMPKAFYDGTSGIEPVDIVIRRVLDLGYCHHIERLMILGNMFVLCEIDPDAVYQWFMELFIDAYDWVMVPNVYGMSQHADGGMMTTKPYISGSSYVLKMSSFAKGDWCAVWDGLFWRFIDKHLDFFRGNPRLSMMAKQAEKMGAKMETHRRVAEEFLATMSRDAK
jgi:deoxyribodipyrimidine photolyase-related protein